MQCKYKGEWTECTYVNTEYLGWSERRIITVCVDGKLVKFWEEDILHDEN